MSGDAPAHAYRNVIITAATAGLAGLLFGYDTGVIAGALLQITPDFGLGSFASGLVVGAVPIGAVLGGLGVTDAVRTAEGVTGSLGDLAPERIVRDLVEADVSVAEFVQVAPALEDLFVQLTGEGFDVSG